MEEVKLGEIVDAINEVLSINNTRLELLYDDVKDGYVKMGYVEREIVLDCVRLAIMVKRVSKIEVTL